jgi:hypothetical protein
MTKEELKQLEKDLWSAADNLHSAQARANVKTKRDPYRFAQRLQRIIDAYNAGSSSADNYLTNWLNLQRI